MTTVLVGGKKRGCMQVDISDIDGTIEGYFTIEYDRRCNASGDLAHGVGTVSMMHAALCFCFQKFKRLRVIYFKDHSKVKCGLDMLSLPTAYLAEHGKTWYMGNISKIKGPLQVRTEIKADQAFLDEFVTKCRAPKGGFEDFWNNHILPRLPRVAENGVMLVKDHKTRIATYWTDAFTIQELVANMKKNGDCDLYLHWLSGFYTGTAIESMNFVVEKAAGKALPALEITKISDPYEDMLTKRKESMRRKKELFDEYIRQHGGWRRGTRWALA